jgi:LmbE family N-acetylglucosaminyl deacetylase
MQHHSSLILSTPSSCGTFLHVPSVSAALNEIRRLLKPGGLLFVNVPNALETIDLRSARRIHCPKTLDASLSAIGRISDQTMNKTEKTIPARSRIPRRMNVLAIGSHPDDVEFGCGGTIRKLADLGHRVSMLVMTDGNFGGDPAVRKAEQERSAKQLKVHDLFWGGYSDTRLPQSQQAIQSIEDIVAKVDPTFVFVHHGRDTHQDHRHTHENAVVATRNVPNLLFYEGPTTLDFSPSVFVDISHSLAGKSASLSCHQSQVNRTNVRRQSIIDIATATAMFRGTQCRATYAEAFEPLRMFIMLYPALR